MSAQSYTNKRRVLAEASLRKVQYPGNIALNNNPILATRNCSPDFQSLIYKPICGCEFNGRGIPPVRPPINPTVCINILSGGGAGTIAYILYDGNCLGSCSIFSGGNSTTSINCQNSPIFEIIYDGGTSSTNTMNILSGS